MQIISNILEIIVQKYIKIKIFKKLNKMVKKDYYLIILDFMHKFNSLKIEKKK